DRDPCAPGCSRSPSDTPQPPVEHRYTTAGTRGRPRAADRPAPPSTVRTSQHSQLPGQYQQRGDPRMPIITPNGVVIRRVVVCIPASTAAAVPNIEWLFGDEVRLQPR